MARIYMERLIKTVIELSHGNDWDTAVVELAPTFYVFDRGYVSPQPISLSIARQFFE